MLLLGLFFLFILSACNDANFPTINGEETLIICQDPVTGNNVTFTYNIAENGADITGCNIQWVLTQGLDLNGQGRAEIVGPNNQALIQIRPLVPGQVQLQLNTSGCPNSGANSSHSVLLDLKQSSDPNCL